MPERSYIATVAKLALGAGPVRRLEDAQLMRGAYSLLANTAVTSMLGMAFWIAAARLYSRATVGQCTVLISAMVELSTICQLNMGNAIVRFMPDLGRRATGAMKRVYGMTAMAALVVGTVFVLVTPVASKQLSYLADAPLLASGFVLALILWGLFTLQDAALTASRRAPWIPLENGLYGLLKLLALPLILWLGVGDGVFLAWTIPMALLVVPVNALLFKRVLPQLSSSDNDALIVRLGTRAVTRFLLQDYLSTVFTQATLTILPLLVIAVLGATESAYFAIPFTIAVAFDTFAYGACAALIVEGTLQSDRLPDLVVVFARRVGFPLVAVAGALVVAAPVVLLPFGHTYAEHGTGVLRLLLCASLLRVGLALFAAISRVRGQSGRLAVLEVSLLVLVLGLATSLARSHGISGVAAAWLIANAAACLVAVPLVRRFVRAA